MNRNRIYQIYVAYLKDVVFEINVFSKHIPKIAKITYLTPQSIIVSELDISLSQLTPFDT